MKRAIRCARCSRVLSLSTRFAWRGATVCRACLLDLAESGEPVRGEQLSLDLFSFAGAFA